MRYLNSKIDLAFDIYIISTLIRIQMCRLFLTIDFAYCGSKRFELRSFANSKIDDGMDQWWEHCHCIEVAGSIFVKYKHNGLEIFCVLYKVFCIQYIKPKGGNTTHQYKQFIIWDYVNPQNIISCFKIKYLHDKKYGAVVFFSPIDICQ